MTRRTALALAAAAFAPAATKAPVVNAAEHTWVIAGARRELATCPTSLPDHDYTAEYLMWEMKRYHVDHLVISHVCYYGRDNSYTAECIRKYPGRFAGIGLLVGYRLYSPADKENASRLERLIKEDGLIGLRLSPTYDPKVVWLNDPVSYPLWKKAEELGGVFNISLQPHQIGQVTDMAARYPGVNVVIDHFANININAPDSEGFSALLALAKLPNVYIRTTLHDPSKSRELPYKDMWPFLHRAYDTFGPRRLIWANMSEYVIMKDLIPFFKPEDKEWILGRTAHRIYKFPAMAEGRTNQA